MKPTLLLCLLIGWLMSASAALSGAQEADKEEAAPIFVSAVGSPTGMQGYATGRWGVVSVVVGNRTETPQVVQATVSVRGREELRFSRDVLVPARSIRETTIPIHLPEGLPADSQLEILGRVAADHRVAKSEFACPARIVSASDTALIQDQQISLNISEHSLDYAYEAALAMRAASGLKRTMLLSDDRMLPSTYQGWDAVGNVIVSGNRLADNPASRQALREWLSQGGRMWIQADTTSVETIRLLLGSALSIERVDQVSLHDFAFEYANKDSQGEPTVVQLEDPVEFHRVIVEGAQVMYEIDGWPAVMKVDVGFGQVYFTMLESRGLIRGRRSGDPPAKNELFYTDFLALEPLQQVAAGLRDREIGASVPVDIRATYVTEQIGYSIPSRNFVVNVLLGFCGLIGIAGVGLSYLGWREHLLWVTLAAAGLATATVVAVGLNSHHAVPATASSLQVVEVFREMNEFSTTGSIATYQSSLGPANVSSTASARLKPQSERLAGKIRNFVWNDSDRWRWNDTVMPAGVQLFGFHRYETLSEPVYATANFTAKGLTGRVQVDALLEALKPATPGETRLSNAILVFPQSNPLVANLTPEGEFNAGIDDVLPLNEFFNSTFVDSAQRQRRAIYQAWYDSYLTRLDQSSYLLGWSDAVDSGLAWGDDVSLVDGALIAIPLTIARTAPETKVSLPGATIAAQSVASQSGQSILFKNSTGRWIFPMDRSTTARLRFQLPAEVLPLKVDTARLFIDCNIPSRVLTIELIEGDQRRTIVNRPNALGKLTFDLVETAPPTLDSRGGMTLEFTIGDLSSATNMLDVAKGSWSIRATRLDITGTTMHPAEVEAQR